MLEREQRNLLVFSGLLQNRRKYLSHLSAIGISVDLHAEEPTAIHAAQQTNDLVMVDLETSRWEMAAWLESLKTDNTCTEAIFVTQNDETDTIQTFADQGNESGGCVAYYCAQEKTLFQNSGGEIQRIIELFASVV